MATRAMTKHQNNKQQAFEWGGGWGGLTAHSCEKCINTDVWGGRGVLGNKGWLSRCVSPAEPSALKVVTQFFLSLFVPGCFSLGRAYRACRAHSAAVFSPNLNRHKTAGQLCWCTIPTSSPLCVGRNFTPSLSHLLTLSGGCDIS